MVSSLEHLQNFWYVACLSETLKRQPLPRRIVDHPIVLFRDPTGRPHALLDRCCHRNMPLSFGKVTAKGLQCGYHGWEFSPLGQCVRIPGQPPDTEDPVRGCVPVFPVVEQDGVIWVYGMADVQPATPPFKIPFENDPAFGTVLIDFGLMHAAFHNVVDNFMDSLHPPFIHTGLIYDDQKRNRLGIEVRSYKHSDGHWGVEGIYHGEPPPTQGLIGRIFAERSATSVIHEERFVAPALTQAEYRIGNTSHLLSTHIFTPETLTRTRMYAVLRTKSRIPKLVTGVILRALFTRLFRQDIRALEIQQRAAEEPGNLPRMSSKLDLLSLTAIYFLRQLSEGHPPERIEIKAQRYDALI